MRTSPEFQNYATPYSVVVSRRARTVRLTVQRDGRVVLTVPRGVSREYAERFAQARAQWIADKVAYFRRLPKPLLRSANKRDYHRYKDAALALARERLAFFNATYGFAFRSITIRNQKTRWGSCSKKGNLSFSYRIALLPPRYVDYIIVHELCHLKEMNHSRAFWALVAQTIPDYRDIRKKIKHS